MLRLGRGFIVCATVIGMVLGLGVAVAPHVAAATTFTVTNCLDDGADSGSLRYAVNNLAAGENTITFATDCPNSAPIILTNGVLTLGQNVTINANGHTVVVDGDNASGVFAINTTTVTVTLDGLTIQHGFSDAACGAFNYCGGGVYSAGNLKVRNSLITDNTVFTDSQHGALGGGIANDGGTLVLANSVIANNAAPLNGGGGIYSSGTMTATGITVTHNTAKNAGGIQDGGSRGTMTLRDSTIDHNTASNAGGGVVGFVGSVMTITNCTIADNTAVGNNGGGVDGGGGTLAITNSTVVRNAAPKGGGGVFYLTGSATLTNTIVAESTGGNLLRSFLGAPFTGSNNLLDTTASSADFRDGVNGNIVGRPALLDPNDLQPNGSAGPRTVALLPGSPAIGGGTTTGDGIPTNDERGVGRVGRNDIGAFQSQGFTLAKTSGDNQTTPPSASFAAPLVVTVASSHGEPVQGGVVTFAGPASGAGIQTSPQTAAIGANGQASVTPIANGTVGSYTVTATASGAAPDAVFTATNVIVTTTAAQDATAPFNAGAQSVALRATVTASPGTVNAGTVTFTVLRGTTAIGSPVTSPPLTDGTATVAYPLPAGTAPGAYTIAAVYNAGGAFAASQDATHTLTIGAAPLTAVTVSPASPTLKVGATQQFTATAVYADSSTADVTAQVTWSSDAPAVARVDNAGKATGIAPGTAHVTATLNGTSGQAAVTVTSPTAVGIAPAPAPANRPSGASVPGGSPAPNTLPTSR